MKKPRIQQPWLTRTGVEKPTGELREIAKSWNAATWENYLTWFETGRNEGLVDEVTYAIICDEQIESIFEQFAQDASQENRVQCERLLAVLPEVEAQVLRLYFMEGRTEFEIGFALKRSQTGISHIKNKALARLKRGNSGDGLLARRFMKGESFSPGEEPSIWDEPLKHPLREPRPSHPDDQKVELEAIKTPSVRAALLELPEGAQRVLYLQYWCEFSRKKTAALFGQGWNVIDEIDAVGVSKVKCRALQLELENTPGGGQCA